MQTQIVLRPELIQPERASVRFGHINSIKPDASAFRLMGYCNSQSDAGVLFVGRFKR